MHRSVTGFGVAVAMGFGVSPGAQSTSTTASQRPADRSSAQEMNVTGCISKSSDGTFMLTNARVEPSTTTSPGTATGTTGSTGATSGAARSTEPSGSGTMSSMTWALKGGSDLEKHVGHKVQVTGRAEAHEVGSPSTTSTTTTTSSTASEAHPRELEVQSLKMISTTCS